MECEICGTDIRGPSFKIDIDRSELTVCAKCSVHGNTTNKRTPVSRKMAPVTQVVPKRGKGSGKKVELMSDELIDDYDHVMREARERKKMTHDQLASIIKEKAALIKKLERGEIVPEESVRMKLEKALGITLTEKSSADDWNGERLNTGATLGDIVKIKRK
jgi:putative transcription factor